MTEWLCLYKNYDIPEEVKKGLEEVGQVDLWAEFSARLTLDVDNQYMKQD
ncbi:hypothetical protein HY837_00200 [archaeon]|nr:hypothetical protein [archaeon]